MERLMTEAEMVVRRTQRRLPAHVRERAEALAVVFHDSPSAEICAGLEDPDLLGLFVGVPFGAADEGDGAVPAHILLFVAEIFDYVEGDWEEFRREVKLTYLHELGHYLGWDEQEVAERGLE